MSTRKVNITAAAAAVLWFCVTSNCPAEHLHTHIGRNPDGVWGNSDDTQLWIFAEPANPQWDTIDMVPTGEFIAGKEIYVAVLDCWHSAHPENGSYQLGGDDSGLMPDWRIELKRVSYSDSVNFWMEEEATGLEILLNDGGTYSFGSPVWSDELYNENGTLGAWYFHVHTEFVALADGPGETFSATFTALDTGGTGFSESSQYTMNFVTVPEPCSVVLLAVGAISLIKTGKRSLRR